ncbi:hypothetical protein DXG01_001796 [Tephrocybe rancida]|nr:hypothetical protein DXG01_001796 [Tephrocybe rancida]
MSLNFKLLDAGVALVCLSLSAWCYCSANRRGHKPYSLARGYILENQVTHARLIPVEASHAFTYPTLAFFVSVDALEGHELDLWGGWVFGYGGRWGRLTGLRSNPYFADIAQGGGPPKTIREKLEDLLTERGYLRTSRKTRVVDSWMLTMPNYVGFEGINPLTVYFCYQAEGLWLVILEIHNTFGETHVHVLEVGHNEDETRPKGYDHQWTFLREFHVSPFNDRSGFYSVSIKSPSHPPTFNHRQGDPPRPAVRIHLHTSSDTPGSRELPGPIKLTALLRPTASYPLTTYNLLASLSRAPFTLLLSLPRILAQAWALHYNKRLDVFLRPEPLPPLQKSEFAAWDGLRRGGGVKWLSEGFLERYIRNRVETFLQHRVDEAGLQVSFVSADPSVTDFVLTPQGAGYQGRIPHLVISYLSPRIFTIIFTSPSPEHALLLGSDTERIFTVSSREFFITLFTVSNTTPDIIGSSPLQRMRARRVPASIPLQASVHHPLDPPLSSRAETLKTGLALRTLFFLERLEHWIFSVAHARVVAGEEPWAAWERAEKVLTRHRNEAKVGQAPKRVNEQGSVRSQ